MFLISKWEACWQHLRLLSEITMYVVYISNIRSKIFQTVFAHCSRQQLLSWFFSAETEWGVLSDAKKLLFVNLLLLSALRMCVCVCIRVYCARASIGVGLRGTSSPYTEERDKWQCSQILDNASNIFRFLTINLLNKINSLILLKSNVCHAGNLATEFLSLLCKDFGEKLTNDRGHFSSKEPQTAVNL